MKKVVKKIIGPKKYESLRNKKNSFLKNRNVKGSYTFISNKKNYEKLCIILAGYKPFLFQTIFDRIRKNVPNDVEVCIVSSGIYSEELKNIAQKFQWSYLYTKRNCVTLAQNLAIKEFSKAKYIYKLDEDIFVTKGYFETLMKTYVECNENGEYKVGFVAPTIPINGFGHLSVLKRFNLVEYYTNKFEKPLYAAGVDRMIESNPEVAKFFWGEGNFLPTIDVMNKTVQKDEFNYVACPIKFSIGAILFNRDTWEDMGYFKVKNGPCMGVDEEQFCTYCMSQSKAIIVSQNTIVGHLSFGKQNKTMENYFYSHKDYFDI